MNLSQVTKFWSGRREERVLFPQVRISWGGGLMWGDPPRLWAVPSGSNPPKNGVAGELSWLPVAAELIRPVAAADSFPHNKTSSVFLGFCHGRRTNSSPGMFEVVAAELGALRCPVSWAELLLGWPPQWETATVGLLQPLRHLISRTEHIPGSQPLRCDSYIVILMLTSVYLEIPGYYRQ